MKVILTQNVQHLGSLGDEVNVKNGYARNFLLPRGMALVPTSNNAKQIDHRRRALEKNRAEAMESARSEADRLSELELTFKAKSGPSGRLFGSVTNRDLQAQLAEHGFELDRRSIIVHQPIKSVGTHDITVKLHTEVKLDMIVKVEPLLEAGEAGTEDPLTDKELTAIAEDGEAAADAAATAESPDAAGAAESADAVPAAESSAPESTPEEPPAVLAADAEAPPAD